LAEVIPTALRNDAIAIIWLLVILFWLARTQGTLDARRDAVNETSITSKADQRPSILAITENQEGQLMILSPDYPRSP